MSFEGFATICDGIPGSRRTEWNPVVAQGWHLGGRQFVHYEWCNPSGEHLTVKYHSDGMPDDPRLATAADQLGYEFRGKWLVMPTSHHAEEATPSLIERGFRIVEKELHGRQRAAWEHSKAGGEAPSPTTQPDPMLIDNKWRSAIIEFCRHLPSTERRDPWRGGRAAWFGPNGKLLALLDLTPGLVVHVGSTPLRDQLIESGDAEEAGNQGRWAVRFPESSPVSRINEAILAAWRSTVSDEKELRR